MSDALPGRFMQESSQLQWFAVRVRSNTEKMVAEGLRGKGDTEFLPLYRKTSLWSDRTNQIDVPLFPGYVFCHFALQIRLPLLTCPPDEEIVALCECRG